ncbi:MAG: hypothetical protein H6Q72_3029 [Firmicutes bacterium]|nr:hypothetical protein [Bacillota bacterium]
MFSKNDMVLTRDLQAGMIIAQPVFSEKRQILLEQGAVVTADTIKQLTAWGVWGVSVACPNTPPFTNPDLFHMYNETLDVISSTFKKARRFKEVPLAECSELVGNYVELMIDIESVLDNLYRIRTHHEYTFTHSLHVAILTGLLGKWMGFTGSNLKNLILAGLLHDIGKALIPQRILDKPGPLTTAEMDIIKLHSTQGYNLLGNCIEIPEEVKLGVLQHHEREDGSGYPFGLKGKDISIYAKFVAIADVYDAMTTDRVYRAKHPPITTIHTMLTHMHTKLDSIICLTFSAKLQKFLLGSRVLLNNGLQGTVVQMPNIATARPVVRLDSGVLVDLDNDEKIIITEILD